MLISYRFDFRLGFEKCRGFRLDSTLKPVCNSIGLNERSRCHNDVTTCRVTLLYLSLTQATGILDLGLKWVRLGLNRTNLGLFHIKPNVVKSDLISQICQFLANLTHFGSKSVIPDLKTLQVRAVGEIVPHHAYHSLGQSTSSLHCYVHPHNHHSSLVPACTLCKLRATSVHYPTLSYCRLRDAHIRVMFVTHF